MYIQLTLTLQQINQVKTAPLYLLNQFCLKSAQQLRTFCLFLTGTWKLENCKN